MADDYYDMHLSLPNAGWSPGLGRYRALVDLLGHAELGGKTLLYLVDGLYAGYYWDSHPFPWKLPPFGDDSRGDWPSSLFASQDPVAIDSVCHDFLLAEWPKVVTTGGGAAGSLRGGAEDYLHEAALAADPPSTIFYDPNETGVRLASLGVHEHWNNSTDKQYGRNLGLERGIELVALRVSRPPATLTCRRVEDRVVVSWDSAFAGYRLEKTTALTPPVTWMGVSGGPVFTRGRMAVTNALSGPEEFYRLVD